MSIELGQPTVLYHYTDAFGLLGIIKPSWPYPLMKRPEREMGFHRMAKLQPSDVRFMNDTEELKLGARLLRPRLETAAIDHSIPEAYRIALANISVNFDDNRVLEWPLRCFASCFCANGDLLSQWRGYAGGTGGFAIGLDRDALENRTYALIRNGWPDEYFPPARPRLEPVVYGDKAGIAAIDDHIQRVVTSEWGSVLTDQRPQVRRSAQLMLFTQLVQSVATIKADAFSEEKEWRLFSFSERIYPVELRARARGLVPYLEVAVNVSPAEDAKEQEAHRQAHPTIVDLVVGPGPEQDEQVLAAKELMRATGHDPEVVRPSKVSYR